MNQQRTNRTATLERVAYILDDAFRIPGTNFRFGVDALLGLLPGGGDVAGGVMAAYTLLIAMRVGAPKSVLVRMGANIAIDAIVGAVPVLGDLFDAGFKANRRNVELLQRYVDQPVPARRGSRAVVAAIFLVLLLILFGAAWVAISLMRWLISLF
jgi:hypothetical protein